MDVWVEEFFKNITLFVSEHISVPLDLVRGEIPISREYLKGVEKTSEDELIDRVVGSGQDSP